jgi:hypothetical protein
MVNDLPCILTETDSQVKMTRREINQGVIEERGEDDFSKDYIEDLLNRVSVSRSQVVATD